MDILILKPLGKKNHYGLYRYGNVQYTITYEFIDTHKHYCFIDTFFNFKLFLPVREAYSFFEAAKWFCDLIGCKLQTEIKTTSTKTQVHTFTWESNERVATIVLETHGTDVEAKFLSGPLGTTSLIEHSPLDFVRSFSSELSPFREYFSRTHDDQYGYTYNFKLNDKVSISLCCGARTIAIVTPTLTQTFTYE